MKIARPLTTLFLLESLDGKITTGGNDERDVDKDFPTITGVKEGLHQYYEIEGTTDFVSFNTAKVQAKIGVNQRSLDIKKNDVSFVIVDNKPHLDAHGSEYFAKRSQTFYLITTNKNHPAYALKEQYPNIEILQYDNDIDFVDVFRRFKEDYDIERVTIQTGGTLNAHLLRLGLIDRVLIVIAPCLIGGKDTQSLIGGESLRTEEDLRKIKALKLTKCEALNDSYVRLEYDVINDTEIIK